MTALWSSFAVVVLAELTTTADVWLTRLIRAIVFGAILGLTFVGFGLWTLVPDTAKEPRQRPGHQFPVSQSFSHQSFKSSDLRVLEVLGRLQPGGPAGVVAGPAWRSDTRFRWLLIENGNAKFDS